MAETDAQRASRLCPTKNFFEEHYGDENRRKVKAALLEAQRLAREDEREACAKLAEEWAIPQEFEVARGIAEAIRDRGSRQPGGAK